MKLELNDLIKAMKGKMGDYTIYTDNHGNVVMRHKPTTPPSKKQIEARKRFAETYKGDWRTR